jgi:hypothetical protein
MGYLGVSTFQCEVEVVFANRKRGESRARADLEVAFSIRYPLSYVSIFVLHVVFN